MSSLKRAEGYDTPAQQSEDSTTLAHPTPTSIKITQLEARPNPPVLIGWGARGGPAPLRCEMNLLGRTHEVGSAWLGLVNGEFFSASRVARGCQGRLCPDGRQK